MTSIRRRLTVWLLAGFLLILVSGGAIFYGSVRSVLTSEFDAALQMKAQALASLVKWEEGGIEFDFADEHMPSFERKDHPEFFQIWLGSGAVEGRAIERSASLGSEDLSDRAGPVDSPEFWNLTIPGGLPGRAVGIRFRPENESADVRSANFIEYRLSEVRLVVARDRTELDAALRAIGVTLVSVGTSILVFTVFIVGFVVRRGLRPLDSLGSRVASIDVSSLSERVPMDSMPAELQPICARLNELLARLEESFRRERRFSANVAHELRTPIAELRTLAEVALKYPEDGPAAARAFQDALEISVQMEKMVAALLLLIRCQSGQQVVRREPVRLDKLVEEVWRPLDVAARNKRVVVSNDLPNGKTVETDADIFRTIVHNLLLNAVEYTPAGGQVGIHASSDNFKFEFQVDNTAETLTPEDMSRLFEPFWRKDPARSNSSHCGLGLTLASECARMLSMEIRAELIPNLGLRMTLRTC